MGFKTSAAGKALPSGLLKQIGANSPIWILGAIFTLLGLLLTATSGKMLLKDLAWNDAVTTTGRVIITEWQHDAKENRLKVTYRYQDDRGAIYHNTGILARKLGKVNFQPGAPIVVLYQRKDKEQSRLRMEIGSGEWLPLVIIGLVEIVAGALFLAAGVHRLRRAPTVSSV